MKYIVLSDSHDNQHNTKLAIDYAKARGITKGFHLGDICAPGLIVSKLMLGQGIHWQCVFGNNDGEVEKLTALSYTHDDFDIHGEWREVEIDGARVYLTHYPDLARNAAETGKYKSVFYGHDHKKHQEMVGDTLLANPGELCGLRTGVASCAVWDSAENTFEIIDLTGTVIARVA